MSPSILRSISLLGWITPTNTLYSQPITQYHADIIVTTPADFGKGAKKETIFYYQLDRHGLSEPK